MKPCVRAVEQSLDVSSNYKSQKAICFPNETAGLQQKWFGWFSWETGRGCLAGKKLMEQAMGVHFSSEQGDKGQELALHCREQGPLRMACLTGWVKHKDRGKKVYKGEIRSS